MNTPDQPGGTPPTPEPVVEVNQPESGWSKTKSILVLVAVVLAAMFAGVAIQEYRQGKSAQVAAVPTPAAPAPQVGKGNVPPATPTVTEEAKSAPVPQPTVACCCCQQPAAPVKDAEKPKATKVTKTESPKVADTPKNATFWGWVHPESSDSRPMPCFATRQINGMPKRCSEVAVKPAEAGENEDTWRTRVAGYVGIKVGEKSDKGTIVATRNADVQVK